MAIKKNAAKADIRPKKQVKATFAECTAEDPLKCRYHGPKMLQAELDKLMGKGAAKVKKTKNGYEITSDDAYDAYNKVAALLPNAKGSLGLKKAFFILGDGGFVTPEGEAELEDADILSSEDAPDKKQGETDDVDDLEGSHTGEPDLSEFADIIDAGVGEGIEPEKQVDEFAEFFEAGINDGIVPEDEQPAEDEPIKDISEEDIKNLVSFKGVTDDHFEQNPDLLDTYKAIITDGTNPNGDALNEHQKVWWNDLLDKTKDANESELPALKVLKATMRKVNGHQEPTQANSTQNNEAEMEKYAAKWNNLMDTAINGKKLQGTQYWAESIQPIVEAYNEAIADNNVEHAFDAVYDLKNAVNEAPENGVSKPPTKDSLIAEMGNVISKMKSEGLDLTWDAKKGNALGKAFEDAINAEDIEGATKALDNFKEYVEFLESGGDAPEEDDGLITDDDVQEFYDAVGVGKIVTPEQIKASKELCNNGTWDGFPPTAANKKWFKENAKKFPDLKFSKAVLEALKTKKKGKNQKSGAKEELVSSLSGNNESMVVEGMLKPLEHDESKFPRAVTKEMLDKALSAPNAKALGGASGDNATLVYIGGKMYVCKKGSGSHAEHIHNEVLADQAYRAGGVRAPDCKEYVFGSSTYKLAEFIEGSRLSDFMDSASDEQKKTIRKDLLQGFPLDVLFSNWDVIGTDRDNVIVDNEGHAWRIDNGGSFSMAAQHNHKNMNWALSHYKGDAEFENWEEEGGWDKRRWIDDYKTMRLDSKNKGLFDAYTTADIFLSAGNIDLGKVVESIQDEGIRKALAKPLFEMKQMAMHAVSADISGIKNNAMLSSSLDAMYAASKKGFREYAAGIVSFSNSGIGSKTSDKDTIPPFPKKKPDPPENPEIKFAQGAKLSNSEYTGTDVSQLIVDAAKTINYHAGFVQKDENGEVVGSGHVAPTIDYKVNTNTIAKFNRIEREKLAELAKTDAGAAQLLKSYDSIVTSMNNGYTLPIEHVKPMKITAKLPADFKTKEQIQFEKDTAKAMDEFQKAQEIYQTVTLPAYNKEKKEWEEKEKAKLHTKKGLQGNLYDIANDFMIAATNTFGIPQNNGENIDFIEKGKDQNKYGGEGKNHVEGATTHNMSFCPAASRLKVLDLLMRGMTLDEIGNIKDADPYINNGHWSTNPAKKWFMDEVKALKADPILCQRLMAAYSVFKGISVLKWENNEAPVTYKGKSIQCINHASHSVGLVRREGYDEGKLNNVSPILQKAPLASCGFQSGGAINPYPYVYEVPLWNVGYTYSDANHKGSQYNSHQGSEHEWVASLMGLTPIKVTGHDGIQMLSILYANDTIKQEMATRAARLKPFLTSLEDLKNI